LQITDLHGVIRMTQIIRIYRLQIVQMKPMYKLQIVGCWDVQIADYRFARSD